MYNVNTSQDIERMMDACYSYKFLTQTSFVIENDSSLQFVHVFEFEYVKNLDVSVGLVEALLLLLFSNSSNIRILSYIKFINAVNLYNIF